MEYQYQVGETTHRVVVERVDEHFQVTVDDRVYEVKLETRSTGLLQLQVDQRRLRAYFAHEGSSRYLTVAGENWLLEKSTAGQARRRKGGTSAALDSGELTAEMPGQVLEVLVTAGDSVTAGQTLMVLEAMKMELRVTAPAAGQVRQVHCQAGQVVERGQVLVELEKIKD